MDTPTAVIFSAFLATAGWLYNGRIQRGTSRRQHTYQIVTQLESDEEFGKAKKIWAQIGAAKEFPDYCVRLKAENSKRLDYLLNRYEFLAASIWCGDIDENFVRRTERSRLIRLYEELADYVEQNRTDYSQPSMWRNGQEMAERWKTDPKLGPCWPAPGLVDTRLS